MVPRVLAGRDNDIAAFDSLIARVKRSSPVRPIVFSGLRGVGKTVLLNRLRGLAEHHRFQVVQFEARPGELGAAAARRELVSGLMKVSTRYRNQMSQEKIRQMIGTVSSFSASLGIDGVSFGIDRDVTRASSGLLDLDLQDTVEDIARALRQDRSALMFFIDEMQDLDSELMESLVTAQHFAIQRELPFFVIGAGLPNLPTKLAESRSYAERLFEYRVIGKLDDAAAHESLAGPARQMGQEYSEDALAGLIAEAGNYPYFLQEFGSAMWLVATSSPFTAQNATVAVELGRARLDSGFFPARWERATPAEREYMKCMAIDGDVGSRSAAVAQRLLKTPQSLAPIRASLIAKGIIYAPQRGIVEYTVPGMASFIERHRQLLEE